MTIEQIYEILKIQKETFSTLSGITISDYQTLLTNLTSDSKVANFELEMYNQAVAIKSIYDKMESETANIQSILANSQVMTGNWYREKTVLFQFQDLVQMVNNVPGYLQVDTEKQIVEFASFEEDLDNDRLLIKVRRKDGTTLSSDEYNGLVDYLETIKGIGLNIEVINLEPDDIKFYFEVIYNPQIGLENLKTAVETALENYVENLPFDSVIYMNDVVDILQNLDGVFDPRPEKISAKINTESTYNDYTWSYDLVAGYGNLVDVDTTITYTPR